MVSFSVSVRGITSIQFVKPDVKASGHITQMSHRSSAGCYQLTDWLNVFIITSDKLQMKLQYTYTHCSAGQLLTKETQDFFPSTFWPPSSLILKPVNDKVRSIIHKEVYRGHWGAVRRTAWRLQTPTNWTDRLTLVFQNNLDKPAPERLNNSGFW